jgi:hypothetical protein
VIATHRRPVRYAAAATAAVIALMYFLIGANATYFIGGTALIVAIASLYRPAETGSQPAWPIP